MEVNGENEDITIDVAAAVVVAAAAVAVAVESRKLEISHVFMVVVLMKVGVLSTDFWDSFFNFQFYYFIVEK